MWQTNYSVVYINYCSISCILLFNHNYWQGGMSVSLSCHRDVCINLLPQGCLYQSLGTGMPVPILILILYFNPNKCPRIYVYYSQHRNETPMYNQEGCYDHYWLADNPINHVFSSNCFWKLNKNQKVQSLLQTIQ